MPTPFQNQVVEWSSDIDNEKVEKIAGDPKTTSPNSPIVEGENLTPEEIELETDNEPSNLKHKIRLKSTPLGWQSMIETNTIKTAKEFQKYTSNDRPILKIDDDGSVGSSGSGQSDPQAPAPASIDASDNINHDLPPQITRSCQLFIYLLVL